MKKEIIKTEMKVKDNLVGVMRVGDVDYISLTDLAKFKNDKNPANVIIHWLSNKDTAFYVGLWEKLNNENFNFTEYREIKINEIETSSYTMSPKQWIQRTNAIGLISKGGKYSIGTYAHPDLAFEFASWLNVEFKLYLIKEFERLKQNESYQNKIEWSVRRELAKTNYKIHTDSIKENIIPTLTDKQKQFVYANEADILNVALFGMTAKEWKEKNPNLDGNMRDYANIIQLVILVNLENGTSFKFDYYDNDGFVMMFDNDKQFLTKINPEILKKVVNIVDVKLTEDIQIYKTNKISITKAEKGKNDTILKNDITNIEEKTAIEYILNQCKNVYTKEIDYEPSIVHPDYEIDFNNNIKLLVYSQNERGWMLKDGFLLEAYGLNSFDTILENTFENISAKKKMFNTDKIKIISSNKEIEITNKDTVEKITTTLIYSKIYSPDWIENYNIKEEYDTGIKVKINDNEFLVPGIKTIGIGCLFFLRSTFCILMNLNLGIKANFGIPFISYESTNLIMEFISLAIVFSIYRRKDIIFELPKKGTMIKID